jgi:soluble lytic murein transglycosylase
MQFLTILTPLLAAAVMATAAAPVQAQNRGDEALLQMQQAYRKGDRARLTQLLPEMRCCSSASGATGRSSARCTRSTA